MKLIDKIINILEYIKYMGLNWFLFRVKYEILKKTNYFTKVNKSILIKTKQLEYKDLFYKRQRLLKRPLRCDASFIEKANNAMNGQIFSFSNEYLDYNINGAINWHLNPISKIIADNTAPWNDLPDFGVYGDIKLIWEASRFSQVYYFIHAHEITKDEIYANACINQILDWIEHNPYPNGIHYKCGQEITFRLFSWIVALEYFEEFILEEEERIIVKNIYSSFLRIASNINYATKSVKNNHSISEASGLLVVGLLFPQFPEAKKMIDKGLNYLIKETGYQVYADGSYIQHSFIYQRLALDVLSFVRLVAQKMNFILPEGIKKKQEDMVCFLNSFMQDNGYLPNYGSNDGANLFLVDGNSYRDFRTSLSFALGKSDFFNIDNVKDENISNKNDFKAGGYYILKNKDIFTFIRCHSYKDRPAQNDMFHLDIWYKEKNIFCDAGSYSYNTNEDFKNNFIGVIGHNTVMLNNTNQMKKVLNFGYTNWTKAICTDSQAKHFRGKNYAYKKDFSVLHTRDVTLKSKKIIILDCIDNITTKTNIKQIWNTQYEVEIIDDYTVKIEDCILSSNIPLSVEKSYISEYYNAYTLGTRVIFEIDTKLDYEIYTTMEFK